MGAGQSKAEAGAPEVDVSHDRSEQTFFAPRSQANVQLDENLIHHLSSSSSSGPSSSSSSTNPVPLSRQHQLDSHIQSRIRSEIDRLQSQERSIRQQIEAALEKENLDKERSSSSSQQGGSTPRHSASLMDDLARLEKSSQALFKGASKELIGNEQWQRFEQREQSLLNCLKNNKETPLDCADQVDKFRQAVQTIETVSSFIAWRLVPEQRD
ncbi:BQ2448_6657 [Microbotryum intermedium]|uniref:BQ2448_6657 protein n=1 Tax=Microbotryum intermedium TaxID=269621 RepID=A0A238FM35_9BASI|nr:BQ2448_6657 [Microbotryum intermedium]